MTINKFDMNQYLKDLEQLVNQDSGSNFPEGTKKIADFFEEKFLKKGWVVKKHYFDNTIGPCLEIKNSDKNEFDILFIGHMDTVFPVGTAEERPFCIKEDKAYGPGVIDMKSGLLSLYYGMKLLNLDEKNKPSFCIAFNSDEEISSKFSSQWLRDLAKRSKYAFVLEPARKNGALVLERKGLAKYKVEFNGVAAHAGVEPEKGISAINELGHWIVELSKLTNFDIGTTVNVGVVSGGTKSNVVAHKALGEIDVRFKLEEEGRRVESKLRELKENPRVSGIKVDIEKIGYRPPMNPSKKTRKLCKLVNEVGKGLGIDIIWASTGGGSDANSTAAVGTPSIDGLGPVGGGAHGISEYLELNTIEPRIRLLRGIIERIIYNS